MRNIIAGVFLALGVAFALSGLAMIWLCVLEL